MSQPSAPQYPMPNPRKNLNGPGFLVAAAWSFSSFLQDAQR
ncbi:hypothetical protein [Rothia dentocariosa]|nr:hypothetical protein [Rothia dentocariosa]